MIGPVSGSGFDSVSRVGFGLPVDPLGFSGRVLIEYQIGNGSGIGYLIGF